MLTPSHSRRACPVASGIAGPARRSQKVLLGLIAGSSSSVSTQRWSSHLEHGPDKPPSPLFPAPASHPYPGGRCPSSAPSPRRRPDSLAAGAARPGPAHPTPPSRHRLPGESNARAVPPAPPHATPAGKGQPPRCSPRRPVRCGAAGGRGPPRRRRCLPFRGAGRRRRGHGSAALWPAGGGSPAAGKASRGAPSLLAPTLGTIWGRLPFASFFNSPPPRPASTPSSPPPLFFFF